MPIYQLQAPDGRIVTLEGPTPPSEQELDQVFSALPPVDSIKGNTPEAIPGQGFGTLEERTSPLWRRKLGSDISETAEASKQAVYASLADMAKSGWSIADLILGAPARTLGLDLGMNRQADAWAQAGQNYAQQGQAAQEMSPVPIVPKTVGSAVSMIPPMLASPAGKLATYITAGAQQGGSTLYDAQKAYEAQGDPYAQQRAAVPALVDALQVMALMKASGKAWGTEGAEALFAPRASQAAGSLGSKIVRGGLSEFSEETPSAELSNVIAKNTYDPQRDPREGVIDAAIASLILGGAGEGVSSLRNRKPLQVGPNVATMTDEEKLRIQQSAFGNAPQREARDFSSALLTPEVLDLIRQAQSKRAIQEALPGLQLSREEAAQLRDLAAQKTTETPSGIGKLYGREQDATEYNQLVAQQRELQRQGIAGINSEQYRNNAARIEELKNLGADEQVGMPPTTPAVTATPALAGASLQRPTATDATTATSELSATAAPQWAAIQGLTKEQDQLRRKLKLQDLRKSVQDYLGTNEDVFGKPLYQVTGEELQAAYTQLKAMREKRISSPVTQDAKARFAASTENLLWSDLQSKFLREGLKRGVNVGLSQQELGQYATTIRNGINDGTISRADAPSMLQVLEQINKLSTPGIMRGQIQQWKAQEFGKTWVAGLAAKKMSALMKEYGVNADTTYDEVLNIHKQRQVALHPDRGGSTEQAQAEAQLFNEITERFLKQVARGKQEVTPALRSVVEHEITVLQEAADAVRAGRKPESSKYAKITKPEQLDTWQLGLRKALDEAGPTTMKSVAPAQDFQSLLNTNADFHATVEEVLNHEAQSDNPDTKTFAQQMLKSMDTVGKKVRIYLVDKLENANKWDAAEYDPDKDVIRIRRDAVRDRELNVHEIAHALSVYKLSHALGIQKKDTPEIWDKKVTDYAKNGTDVAVKELCEMYLDAKNRFFVKVNGQPDARTYGLQTIFEFVAEGWSNKQFRSLLASIKWKNTNLSLLDKFKQVIAKLLGKNFKGTMLDAFFDASDKIIQRERPQQYKWDVTMEDALGGNVRPAFSLISADALLDAKKFGVSNIRNPMDGTQLLNRLRNLVNPTEWKLLEDAGIRKAFDNGKWSPTDVAQWIQENGPRVEVKKFGNESQLNPLEKQFNDMTHNWFDTHPIVNHTFVEDVQNAITLDRLPREADAVRKTVGDVRKVLSDEEALKLYDYAKLGNDIERGAGAVTSDNAHWQSIAPKSEQNMPGYVEGAVVIPLKAYPEKMRPEEFATSREGIAKQRGQLFPESHNFPPNTLAFYRGYVEMLPSGEKVFHVIEVQSDWGQRVREDKKASVEDTQGNYSLAEFKRNKANEMDHPLLRDYNRLALKAAIEHARQEGATKIAIQDAQSAMMQEGHDRIIKNAEDDVANWQTDAMVQPTWLEDGLAQLRHDYEQYGAKFEIAVQPRFRDKTLGDVKDGEDIKAMRERALMGNPDQVPASNKYHIVMTRRPFEAGMTLNYDQSIPKILTELTGNKGEKVSFGEHKMAFERVGSIENYTQDEMNRYNRGEGIQRQDLIFRNPDGTPKTDVSATMFDLTKVNEKLASQPFTLTGKMFGRKHNELKKAQKAERKRIEAENAIPFEKLAPSTTEQRAKQEATILRKLDNKMHEFLDKHFEMTYAPEVYASDKPAKTETLDALAQAIVDAPELRERTEALRAEERAYRGKRLADVRNNDALTLGERTRAMKSALKGELPRQDFEPLQNKLSAEQINTLADHLNAHSLLKGEDYRAANLTIAFEEMVQNGTLPEPNQLLWFEKIFGEKVVAALTDKYRKRTAWRYVAEAGNVARTALTGYDLSATLRQGFTLAVTHPKTASRAFVAQLRAFGNEAYAKQVDRTLRGGQRGEIRRAAGLDMPSFEGTAALFDVNNREEQFTSHAIQRLAHVQAKTAVAKKLFAPVKLYAKGLAASERAYVTYMNWLRATTFDVIDEKLQQDYEGTALEEQRHKLAKLLNATSGRGNVKTGALAAFTFFAPRYKVSRFEAPVLMSYYSTKKGAVGDEARRMVAAQSVAWLGLALLLKGAAEAFDWPVEFDLDPKSTNFLRAKIYSEGKDKPTSIDISGGYGNAIRYMVQGATSERHTKKRPEFQAKTQKVDQTYLGGQLIRGSMAPLPGTALNIAKGSDMNNEKPTVGNVVMNLTTPITAQNIADFHREHGALGLALLIPDALGLAVTVPNKKAAEK